MGCLPASVRVVWWSLQRVDSLGGVGLLIVTPMSSGSPAGMSSRLNVALLPEASFWSLGSSPYMVPLAHRCRASVDFSS